MNQQQASIFKFEQQQQQIFQTFQAPSATQIKLIQQPQQQQQPIQLQPVFAQYKITLII